MVRYSVGGHWTPTIPGVICQQCGCSFTAHSKTQRYCSRQCVGAARMAARNMTERTCPTCEKVWLGWPKNPSRYCSKDCMYEGMGWSKRDDRDCAHCGTAFHPNRDDRSYCSRACADEGKKSSVPCVCPQCGDTFEKEPSRKDITCSFACKSAYYIRDRSPSWAGGKVLQNERLSRRIDRDGYASKYEGEHRLIAARELGRPISRGELVICLDRNNENMVPANLFLVPSQKEWGFIRNGAVEWPSESNLTHLRSKPYVRPDVILTLHEWENGKRRESDKGKPITRHPQADEIIKRRKAGASVRELADEFGGSFSQMSVILKKRL
ncbi:hypothetical protein UFOVP368_31 [uncultured Caudovirales phage]|uniref:HNH nuclease domain-containing protein n=1 Tax=uncultured Caudovirales phage TaxID=2100421 RepID=A0A6J7WXM9_9CAUD|nr:hypothetical protein UFOVP368_31 [uncultured Caudovirales phage]